MKAVLIFKKALGLNNFTDPKRLSVNFETGETELAEAYNVSIDSSGRVVTRNGLTQTARKEKIHSLFCEGGDCLFAYADALYRLNKDYSAYGITNTLTAGIKVSYCQIADRIYYTNGYQKGFVIDGVGYPWIAESYVGPVTHRIFSDPPLLKDPLLTYLSGRIYIASGRIGWYSEPNAYGWFDLASNYIDFGQKIKMWRAVSDGIYVGLDRNVIFLEGTNPADFKWKVVSDYPVKEGSDVYTSNITVNKNSLIPSSDYTLRSVMWTSQNGIYVGQTSGNVANITLGKLVIPEAVRGCAVFGNNEYIMQFK